MEDPGLAGVLPVVLTKPILSATRMMGYAALAQAGVLPDVGPKANEPPTAYLKRSATALARKHPKAKVTLLICPRWRVNDISYELHPSTDVPTDWDQERLVAMITWNDAHIVSARGLARALNTHDWGLAAALLGQITIGGYGTIGIQTPMSTWENEFDHLYDGDARYWWKNQRTAAATNLNVKEKSLSNLDVRKFVRKSGMLTPGQYCHALGLVRRNRKPKLRTRIERLADKRLRDTCLDILDIAHDLEIIGKVLGKLMRDEDRDVFGLYDGCEPVGLAIETTDKGLVSESVEDYYQGAVQSGGGFFPNSMFDVSTGDLERITRAIELYESVSVRVGDLEAIFNAFEGNARKRPRKRH